MTTKTELVARVNHEFPRYWRELIATYPTVRSGDATFPTLVSISVGEVSRLRGFSASLCARFVGTDGKEYALEGNYWSDWSGSGVFLEKIGGVDAIERDMLGFLFDDLCSNRSHHPTGVDYWMSLPD